MWISWDFNGICPSVLKHGQWEIRYKYGGFNWEIYRTKVSIVHGHVWLPEGTHKFENSFLSDLHRLQLYHRLFSTKIRICYFCTCLSALAFQIIQYIILFNYTIDIILYIYRIYNDLYNASLFLYLFVGILQSIGPHPKATKRQEILAWFSPRNPGPRVRRPVGPSTLKVAQQRENQGLLQ